jgi:hypothetical protein
MYTFLVFSTVRQGGTFDLEKMMTLCPLGAMGGWVVDGGWGGGLCEYSQPQG